MPLGRRRPLERAAVIGTVAYEGSKHGAEAGENEAQAAAPPPPAAEAPPPAAAPVEPTVDASGALTDEEFAAAKAKALGID